MSSLRMHIKVYSCGSGPWLGSLRRGISASNIDIRVEAKSQALGKSLFNRVEHELNLDKQSQINMY